MRIGIDVFAERSKKGLFSRFRKSVELLTTVQEWFVSRDAGDVMAIARGLNSEGCDSVFLRLHPAAEEVEIAAAPGGLQIFNKTSTVGPGYHQFVIELVDAMARDLDLRLTHQAESETVNFAISRDFESLRREMLHLLGAIAAGVLRQSGVSSASGYSINMDLNAVFAPLGFANTPMGPRDRTWFIETSKNPIHGVDLWPWYNEGKSAEYYRGVAVALMWTELPWRAPLNDDESTALAHALASLDCAFDWDPGLGYPWREWLELLSLTESEDSDMQTIRERAAHVHADAPLIGYRRYPVEYRNGPGNWQVQVPGRFIQEFDEESNWMAWDDKWSVHLSGWSTKGTPKEFAADALDRQEMDFNDGDRRGVGGFSLGDDSHVLIFNGTMVQGDKAALITIVMPDDGDRAIALDVWRSLRNPRASGNR
jgi:hypothetical protein